MILWSAILETSPLETDPSTQIICVSNVRTDPSVTSTWDRSETAPNLNAIKASHQSLTELHYLSHIKQHSITLKTFVYTTSFPLISCSSPSLSSLPLPSQLLPMQLL
jgi:hypothetical protein